MSKPSHCIVWGGPVYNYIKDASGITLSSEEIELHKGFAHTKIQVESGHVIKLMKVHHLEMPNFAPYSEETVRAIQDILQ